MDSLENHPRLDNLNSSVLRTWRILDQATQSYALGESEVVDVVVFVFLTVSNLLAGNITIDESRSHQMMYVEFLGLTVVVQSNSKQPVAVRSRVENSIKPQTHDLTVVTHRVVRKSLDFSPLLFDHSLISFLILLEYYSVEFIGKYPRSDLRSNVRGLNTLEPIRLDTVFGFTQTFVRRI